MARPLTRTLRHAALAALVLLVAPSLAPGVGRSAFDRGANVMAAAEIKRALREDPDNCTLHARLGVLHARRGMYPDALASLEICPGGTEYEASAIAGHANTLRAFGRGDEAAELRMALLLTEGRDDLEVRILLEAATDLKAYGDLEGALDMCWRAVGLQPNGSAIHAQIAEVHWAAGDRDAAEFHTWLATRTGQPRLGAVLMQARFELADGDLIAVAETLERARRMQPKNLDAAILRAELKTREGSPNDAVAMLSRDAWENNESPELLLARAQALEAAERLDDAAEVRARHAALYGS